MTALGMLWATYRILEVIGRRGMYQTRWDMPWSWASRQVIIIVTLGWFQFRLGLVPHNETWLAIVITVRSTKRVPDLARLLVLPPLVLLDFVYGRLVVEVRNPFVIRWATPIG